MLRILFGMLLVVAGVAVLVGGISLAVAWLIFCFGSVIVGILLLVFMPTLLVMPFTLALGGGVGLIGAGVLAISEGWKGEIIDIEDEPTDNKPQYDYYEQYQARKEREENQPIVKESRGVDYHIPSE